MIGYTGFVRSRFRSMFILLVLFIVLFFLFNDTKIRPGYASNKSNWILVHNPDHDHNNLKDLEFLDDENGWAVGENGTILNWDGGVWSEATSPVTQTLNAIDMYSISDGWIVGENQTLLHWDGYVWNLVDPGLTNLEVLQGVASYLDIDMIAPDQVWVVGVYNAQAIIIYYDGYRWRNWESPTDKGLYSVAMFSDDDGWSTGIGGYVIKKILGDWVGMTSPTENDLYAVINISSDEGLAVGVNGTILHRYWNEWHEMERPTIHTLRSISMVNLNNIWIVGDHGTILKWDGNLWSHDSISLSQNLNAIFMISDDNGWIAGDNGILLQYWTSDLFWNYFPIVQNDY